jgi:hypothetical protein
MSWAAKLNPTPRYVPCSTPARRIATSCEIRPEILTHHYGEAATADKAITYWHHDVQRAVRAGLGDPRLSDRRFRRRVHRGLRHRRSQRGGGTSRRAGVKRRLR